MLILNMLRGHEEVRHETPDGTNHALSSRYGKGEIGFHILSNATPNILQRYRQLSSICILFRGFI